MGTHVRVKPNRIAAVSVGIVWGAKNHRDPRPELLAPAELAVAIVDLAGSEPVVERSYSLRGRDLDVAADHLLDLGVPLVGYNLFHFDWLSLSGHVSPDPLIPVSINLRSVLLCHVGDLVAAEGSSAVGSHNEYGILNFHRLARANLGELPHPEGGFGEADASYEAELTAALWHKLVDTERAVIAGHVYGLSDDDLDVLCGVRPAFESAAAWRNALRERPSPRPYRKRTRHPVTFPRIDQRYV